MRHFVILCLILSAFWLFNSGHYDPLLLSLGGISIIFVIFIAHRMDVVDHESQPLHLTLKMPVYYLWLIKEIVVANFIVVKHIWLGNSSISPSMAILTSSQKSDIGKVIYANSITLTPGTVTLNLEGDKLLVHALVKQSIEDLETGDMDRRVTELED